MTTPVDAGFVIQPDDSAAFARLSGDFNPLHLDPVAARRLQFGGTVCHGVHLVLQALEALAHSGALRGRSLHAVSAVFHQPVRTGVAVRCVVTPDAGGGRVKVSGMVAARPQFTVQVTLGPAAAAPEVAEAQPESACAALNPSFPADASALQAASGAVPLRLNSALLQQLFPALAAWPDGRAVAADLMASTNLVGMRHPGQNSIYSEFKLHRSAAPCSATVVPYSVEHADPRFQKVRLRLQGALLEGTVDAFFRAPPVAQRTLDELATITQPGCVAGQRALVVGGSRGLGELVAKMLLAGGAEVTITYARGEADAARTVAAARERGAVCQALKLDATVPLAPDTAAALAQAGYTHLYHFATPAIGKSPSGQWSQALFDSYCRIYVAALDELCRTAVEGSRDNGPLHVFYPSTVFLDKAERGFAEYCAAKAAGETLCDHLALNAARFVVQRPRLARMKTDQNSSVLGPDAADPFPAMALLLQGFCGWQAVTLR
jgi:acyl dehydratase/NADP-dependent 3-hydroxy acid dehydrogenase YdfG